MKTRIIITAEFSGDENTTGFVDATTNIIRARVDEITRQLQHNAETLILSLKFTTTVETCKNKVWKKTV